MVVIRKCERLCL